MPNGLEPDRMTDDERLDEVAELLAVGILRHHVRQLQVAEKRRFLSQNQLAVSAPKSPDLPRR